ncbi:hypothetical protein PR202_ga30223 [Eleusine coracana subsp. coracana]|uniref:Secreted protein n=1 Tax=Eleusine coracana subsp. coracana TaxID=191504 RepID=A0AAV5DLY6_ELECO|nr:hypothetical protein PR202_ga30223 [Eleusine coracana subsp. coracana]
MLCGPRWRVTPRWRCLVLAGAWLLVHGSAQRHGPDCTRRHPARGAREAARSGARRRSAPDRRAVTQLAAKRGGNDVRRHATTGGARHLEAKRGGLMTGGGGRRRQLLAAWGGVVRFNPNRPARRVLIPG